MILDRSGRLLTAIAAVCALQVASGLVPQVPSTEWKNFGSACRNRQIETVRFSANDDEVADEGMSKRARLLKKLGIYRLKKKKETPQIFPQTTREGLDTYFDDEERRFRDKNGDIDYDSLLAALSVIGTTQIIGSPEHMDRVHPVLKLLHERRRSGSKCTEGLRPDGFKVALAVEGGGMRGCVSAGMVAAIHYLGLDESIDIVYGSSAGSIIGSYFVTRQLPWFGPEVYYDSLTTAGKTFIDSRRLLRAIGFGLLDPRLLKDVVLRPDGKPVLNLSFLLKTTAIERKSLDWDKFVERQKVQPLKVVASALRSEKSVAMGFENGSFESLEELTNCMHASCLLPGIAGPLMNMNTKAKRGQKEGKFAIANNMDDNDMEPMLDSLLYEPMPFHKAIEEGATHVLVLRTRPDGVDTTGKSSIFERLIFKRIFMKKNKLPKIYKRVRMHLHKYVYGRDVIALNEAAQSERDFSDLSSPHMMPIALPPGSEEVTRLETDRQAIFDGVRRGFARAYDALVEDPSERGRGALIAKQCFPDEIMDYDPLELKPSEFESAFDAYLRVTGVTPKVWSDLDRSSMPDPYTSN